MTGIDRRLVRRVIPFRCVDDETEALTKRGWVSGVDLTLDDEILAMDPATMQLRWSPVNRINRTMYDGEMYAVFGSGIDALVTPGHNWVTNDGRLVPVEALRQRDVVTVMGDGVDDCTEVYANAFVRLVGWAVCEGHYKARGGKVVAVEISQSESINHLFCESIRADLTESGAQWHEFMAGVERKIRYFGVTGSTKDAILSVAPSRVITPEFLVALSLRQRRMLVETMIDADGHRARVGDPRAHVAFTQKSVHATGTFVALAAMAGYATTTVLRRPSGVHVVTLRATRDVGVRHLAGRSVRGNTGPHPTSFPKKHYRGMVWCPSTGYETFVARRNGKVYVTGTTSPSTPERAPTPATLKAP